MYSYFQRDGLEKGWFADDFDILEKLSICEGDVDGKEYVTSAIQILKERDKKLFTLLLIISLIPDFVRMAAIL